MYARSSSRGMILDLFHHYPSFYGLIRHVLVTCKPRRLNRKGMELWEKNKTEILIRTRNYLTKAKKLTSPTKKNNPIHVYGDSHITAEYFIESRTCFQWTTVCSWLYTVVHVFFKSAFESFNL